MELLRLRFTVMGGPGEVHVAAPDQALALRWARAAEAEARRIEARFSRYRPDSWLSQVNAAAGGQAVPADDEAMALLAVADALWRDSAGRFDATSGVLRHAWRFGAAAAGAVGPSGPDAGPSPARPAGTGAPAGRGGTAAPAGPAGRAVPPGPGGTGVTPWPAGTIAPPAPADPPTPPGPEVLRPLLARVGWARVQWRDGAVRLPEPGMELDFGGFGKEYAVDRMVEVLRDAGAGHALVNLAGDCRALGARPDGQPWAVGVAHPRRPGALLATLGLAGAALATSGDYERGLWHQGARLGHVLDARTGWPVQVWAAVSVVAPTALEAGNRATLALLAEGDALPALRASGCDFLAVEAASGSVHHR